MCPGITDGQPVDAANSNAAWLSKNGDDTTIGVLGLNNSAPSSGVPIVNTQGALNVIIEAVGGSQSTPATAYGPLPANTISGLTHEQALGVIARFFQGATGHNHDGTDGNGPAIANVVNSLGVTGGTGYPMTGDITLSEGIGIHLNQTPRNIEIAAAIGLPDVLSVNNQASAGINFAGGAIAGLSYETFYVTTPPSAFYPSSGSVSTFWDASDYHYYAQPASGHGARHRIDTSVAASGQSAIYGDVVIAPSGGIQLGQSGNTITVYAPTGGGVTSAAVSGSSPITGAVTFSASGSVQLGQSGQNIAIYAPASGTAVNTIAASGSTGLTGAVTLSASGGIVLTQSGQDIQIYAPTGGGSGGTGVNISNNIFQTNHGFTVPQVLRYNGTSYSLACASADGLSEVLGMVTTVIDANNFTLTNAGYINTVSGLAAGSTYYLSAATAGAIDVNAPSTVGYISKPVFVATAASAGYAIESRGVVIAPSTPAVNSYAMAANDLSGGSYSSGNTQSFATIDYDYSGGAWNGTTTYTAPVAGVYVVTASIKTSSTNFANNSMQQNVKVNGTEKAMVNAFTAFGVGVMSSAGAAAVFMNAGDTLTIGITGTTSIPTDGTNKNRLSIYKLP